VNIVERIFYPQCTSYCDMIRIRGYCRRLLLAWVRFILKPLIVLVKNLSSCVSWVL